MSALDRYAAFGVTVFTRDCAFQAEIGRAQIGPTVNDIEASLNELGVEADDLVRITAVIANAETLAEMLAKDGADQETLLTEIAFGFIYAFVKQQGLEALAGLRGFVGIVADDKLYLKAAEDDASYAAASAQVRKTSVEAFGICMDDYVDQTGPKPTIH